MAVQDQVTALGIARSYAALVREEPATRGLWVTDCRDYFELWLLIEPTDDDTELRLYGADRPLYDLFPEVGFRTFIINPHDFIRLDLDMILPRNVQEVPLRPE